MWTPLRRTTTIRTTPAAGARPVSGAATLDAWTKRDWSDGLDLGTMPELAALEVVTRHSVYYVVPAGDCEVLVRGGRYLPSFRPACAIGCSMGGALLKQHAIHIGFRMEIVFDDMRLVTSTVTSIRVLPEKTD